LRDAEAEGHYLLAAMSADDSSYFMAAFKAKEPARNGIRDAFGNVFHGSPA
jgi:hypothetical protein